MKEEKNDILANDKEGLLLKLSDQPLNSLSIHDANSDMQCTVKSDGTWEYGPNFDPEVALAALFTGIGHGYANGEKAVAKLKDKGVNLLNFLTNFGDAIAASYARDDE